MIEIPGLGPVKQDAQFDDWLRREPLRIHVLGDVDCELILEGYEEDENKEEFHEAIHHFLSLDSSALIAVQDHIFQYYKEVIDYLSPDDEWYVDIKQPDEVWQYVELCREPAVMRRPYGDKKVYISLCCRCDWEQEHGLQIVFKQGLKVNKIGPFDGHLTNSDAYDDESLENVIYK